MRMRQMTVTKPLTLDTSESTEEYLPTPRSKSSYGFTSSLRLTCTQLTRMGSRTLTLLFGLARTKSKTETTTSLNS